MEQGVDSQAESIQGTERDRETEIEDRESRAQRERFLLSVVLFVVSHGATLLAAHTLCSPERCPSPSRGRM